MSKFLFEGDFKRKPIQNLGGRSKHAEDRDMILRKAQLERQKRENERARAAALLVIQAGYRGMRERRKVQQTLRQDFQRDMTAQYTIEGLERQMTRLNYFFKSSKDIQLFCDLAKPMLSTKQQLMVHVLQDEVSMLRLRLVLEKALVILSEPQASSRNVVVRLLETFTDWQEFENARTKVVNVEQSRTEDVMASIWSHLVLQNEFFARFKHFLENKMEINDRPGAERVCKHFDYMVFYRRFLEATRRLSFTYRSFRIGKVVYVTKELVQVLLLKLAESLSTGILRYRGRREVNWMITFIHYHVAQELNKEQNGKSLWKDEWFEVVLKQAEQLTCPGDDITSSKNLRPVMQSFLQLTDYGSNQEVLKTDFYKVLNSLLIAVDNRKQLFKMPDDDDYAIVDDDDEYMNDVEMRAAEEAEMAADFFFDRSTIFELLVNTVNKMATSHWLMEFTPAKWNLIYPVMNCLIEYDRGKSWYSFNMFPTLWNDNGFMRVLCNHVIRKDLRCKAELVVFCWLLNQLMRVLHDEEFLKEIPLSKDELEGFIRSLVDAYADTVLSDKDVNDRLENYYKKEIIYMLMSVHDRNTRINMYSEDVFISTKFSVVFPMETHGIKFKDFCSPFQSGAGTLSLLDQRLVRVLSDFPFALSFHNRVSIWHQLLRADHLERHVLDNPLGRQHIQIRRTYIYEDAFEKLSQENVPDLRSDVRISLVNVVGVQEAGVDGGGLLREFLTEATKAGVNPNRGLFRVDSENRIYPNPIAKRIFPDYTKHFFLMGRLVGKALYRQILLELPLAAFFLQLATLGTISSAVDYLATLDPDLHKNLLKLKTYRESFSDLGLDFTLASDEFGEAKIIELKPSGANIFVDYNNVIEYIHLVADYKINREIMEEIRWFRSGLHDVVPVLRIFSWKEMQTLISGSDKPINVADWKAYTNYAGGYTADHNTIKMFWEVIEHFDEEHLRKLLKFVTCCSRPPLLGFKDLNPHFGISNAGISDRLPTAATCMNLLKLPEFADIETLRERLVYAINAQAGFELS